MCSDLAMKINSMTDNRWFYNYRIKLFSLLSALLLWFYVITDNNFEYALKVPVHLINMPSDWMLTQPIPLHIKVLFSGSGKSLLSLHYRKKRMDINMKRIHNKVLLPLSIDMIQGIPEDLNVVPLKIISPESIFIELDRFITKKLPIQAQISIIPMDGYTQVGEISILPDSLVVSGPQSLVNNIDKIMTEEKTYRNLVKPLSNKIAIIPPQWETVQYAASQTTFYADIQRIGEKTISEIPVQVIGLPKNMKATVIPSTLSVKLQGGVKILSKIKKEDIKATIDFRKRTLYDRKKMPAIIKLPPEISLSDVRPEFFELVVER